MKVAAAGVGLTIGEGAGTVSEQQDVDGFGHALGDVAGIGAHTGAGDEVAVAVGEEVDDPLFSHDVLHGF